MSPLACTHLGGSVRPARSLNSDALFGRLPRQDLGPSTPRRPRVDPSADVLLGPAEPPELLDPPGQPDLGVGGNQFGRWSLGLRLHDHVEFSTHSALSPLRPRVLHHLAQLLWRRAIGVADPLEGRKHAVEAGRAPKRPAGGPAAAGPDRDPRALARARLEHGLLHGVVPPGEREWLSAPQAANDLQTFVEAIGPHARIGILAERGVVLARRRAQ